MAKYIIEFPDYVNYVTGCQYENGEILKETHFPVSCLTSYTEPDEDEIRQKVENEVWEFVRIICDMTQDEREECFGGSTCDLDRFMTYQSAKAEYEAWMKRKDLRIGDEVILPDETRGIIMNREDDDCVVINKDSYTIVYHVSELRNTGRHYDCIVNLAEVLKRYRDAV